MSATNADIPTVKVTDRARSIQNSKVRTYRIGNVKVNAWAHYHFEGDPVRQQVDAQLHQVRDIAVAKNPDTGNVAMSFQQANNGDIVRVFMSREAARTLRDELNNHYLDDES